MAYQPNIPLATDRLRVSQGDLNGNFQNAGGSGGLGTMLNPNQGYIQFPNQAIPPSLTANQPGLYGATPALTGVEELYVNKNISGPAFVQIPMTASFLSNTVPVQQTGGMTGWTYLPSGLLFVWGKSGPIAPNTITSYTIPSGGEVPAFNAVFTLQVTSAGNPSNPVSAILPGNVNPQIIQFYSLLGIPVSAYFLAIGY